MLVFKFVCLRQSLLFCVFIPGISYFPLFKKIEIKPDQLSGWSLVDV